MQPLSQRDMDETADVIKKNNKTTDETIQVFGKITFPSSLAQCSVCNNCPSTERCYLSRGTSV